MDQFVALLYLGLAEFESAEFKARLAPRSPEATLPWLIGCWSTTRNGVTIEERWTVASNGSLDGRGRTLRGGKVVGSETVRITGQGDSLRYTADPSGQSVATFAATQVTDSSVTFANPAHDFPTRISYRRAGHVRPARRDRRPRNRRGARDPLPLRCGGLRGQLVLAG